MRKLLALALTLAACVAVQAMDGHVVLTKKKGMTIHTYVSPERSTMVTSHIIETAKSLVIVDAQFMRSDAKELREYANSLKKPIDRLIISHSHPDHWFGLEFFQDVPIYALAETQTEIKKLGAVIIKSKKPFLKDLVTDKAVVPTNVVELGVVKIDGVSYTMEKIVAGEAHNQLLISLPEQRVIITQDLCFNNVHLFIGQNELKGWEAALDNLQKIRSEFDVWLVGHGWPSDSSVINSTRDYVACAGRALKKAADGKQLKSELCNEYKNHRCSILLDISNGFLFQPRK